MSGSPDQQTAALERDPGGGLPIALLALLPAALLAWPFPGAPLEWDPLPRATGTGLALLAFLPALAWCALAGSLPRVPALGLLVGTAAVAVVSHSAGRLGEGATDSFAAAVGGSSLLLLCAAVWVGASLDGRGRAVLVQGLVLLSLVWTATALMRPGWTDEPAYVGVLGNTGTLSQAALPGALAGAWLAVAGSGSGRGLGLAACLLFLAHAALTPVWAGGLAAAAVLGLGALGSPWARDQRWVRGLWAGLALAAIAALLLGAPLRSAAPGPVAEATTESAPATEGDTGGFRPRLLIWQRLPAMVIDHPLLGVGPGQFEARFPPYRDPAEIELSSRGRALGEVAVEHPHSDWLALLPTLGLVGGGLWLLFLLAATGASWSALREPRDAARASLGAAGLGLLLNALVHGPLLENPASLPLAGLIFGALLGRPREGPAPPGARLLPWALLLLALAAAPSALDLVRHGRALTERAGVLASWDAAARNSPEQHDAQRYRRFEAEAVERALAARPDSPLALALGAQPTAPELDDPERRAATLTELLALRPHDVAALIALGLLDAQAGRSAEARERWRHAVELDPAHPRALFYLALLAVEEERWDDAEVWLASLEHNPHLDASRAEDLARALLLRGRPGLGLPLTARLDPRLAEPRPELLALIAGERRATGDERLADALETAANQLWARGHAERGDFATSVRVYRQALLRSRRHLEGGGHQLRYELALALEGDGRGDEALEILEELGPEPVDGLSRPPWANW